MPRSEQIPSCPLSFPGGRQSGEVRTYRIKLITPLFGGGVEAGINDTVTPIRGKTVRGHLQFWWRATRGAECATLGELHRRQSDIWGTTEHASKAQVSVMRLATDESLACAQYEWRARGGRGTWQLDWLPPFTGTELPYVLFPFQGKRPPDRNAQPEQAPATCFRQVVFELQLRAPSALWIDVEAALWAWVNFGGIGSRTRRGCGALSATPGEPGQRGLLPPSADTLDSWWDESAKRYGLTSPTAAREWPTLVDTARKGRLLCDKTATGPIEAWDRVIRLFKHFRQGPGLGRDPGSGGVPGRSRYPEPESIRSAAGTRAPKHARLPIPDEA
ncbi:MAG: type III-B CRISPR module RAMP protein Cmr1, partial [Tepidiformaceae bacterium]